MCAPGVEWTGRQAGRRVFYVEITFTVMVGRRHSKDSSSSSSSSSSSWSWCLCAAQLEKKENGLLNGRVEAEEGKRGLLHPATGPARQCACSSNSNNLTHTQTTQKGPPLLLLILLLLPPGVNHLLLIFEGRPARSGHWIELWTRNKGTGKKSTLFLYWSYLSNSLHQSCFHLSSFIFLLYM